MAERETLSITIVASPSLTKPRSIQNEQYKKDFSVCVCVCVSEVYEIRRLFSSSRGHFYLVQAKLSSLFIYITYHLSFYNFLSMLNCFTDPVYEVTSLYCPALTATAIRVGFFTYIEYREINLLSKDLGNLFSLICLLDCSRLSQSSQELSQD